MLLKDLLQENINVKDVWDYEWDKQGEFIFYKFIDKYKSKNKFLEPFFNDYFEAITDDLHVKANDFDKGKSPKKKQDIENYVGELVNDFLVPLQKQYNKVQGKLIGIGKKYNVNLYPISEKEILRKMKNDLSFSFDYQKPFQNIYVNIEKGNVGMGLLYNFYKNKFQEFELNPFDEYGNSDQDDYAKVISVINILTNKKGKVKTFYSSQPEERIEKIRSTSKLFNGMYIADSRNGADKYWVIDQNRSIISFKMNDLYAISLGSGEYQVMGTPKITNINISSH